MNLVPWLRQKMLEEYGLKAADTPALSEAIETVSKRRGVSDSELCRSAWQDSAVRLEIAAALTVGESYFLRHTEQEDAIRSQVESVLARGRRARVWSAGCSQGEEPFSVGMLLIERFGSGVRAAVEIEATDIDDASLKCGKSGVFSPWSLRGVSTGLQGRYFERLAGGFRIREELRSWVRFFHTSVQSYLLDVPTASIDLILFRNVGIYLTAEALTTIHEGFSRVLSPDGLLLQAATDPAPPQRSVLHRWAEGPFGSYRVHPVRVETPGEDRPRKRTISRAAFGARSGPWPRTARISGEQPVASDDNEESSAAGLSISTASALADAGRVQDAMELVSRLIEKHPRQRSGYVLRAQLRLHEHDCVGAVEDLRRALLLDPGDCLARYWYSVALGEAGQFKDAQAQRRVLASYVAGRNGSDRLSDGETTVDELRALMPDAAKELA